MTRRLLSCLWPGVVALALLWLALRQLGADADTSRLLAWPIWPLFLLQALLAARFHRSRLIFGVVVLALSDQALHWLVAASPASDEVLTRLLTLLPFVAGLALLLASVLPERGLLTLKGGLQLALFLGPAAFLAWLARRAVQGSPVGADQVGESLSSPSVDGLTAWLTGDAGRWIDEYLVLPAAGAPWPHLAFFGVLVGVQLGRYVHSGDPAPRVFAWVSLAVPFIVWPAHPSLSSLAAEPRTHLLLGISTILLALATLEVSYALAYRDQLTRLPGRRALEDRLHQLTGTYTLAMVDIDHFKRLNDLHGHDVGDQVLRMVAAQLLSVGGGGKPYRYGGEEFTLVFAGRSVNAAGAHLDALRQRIAETAFTIRRSPRPKTGGRASGGRSKRGKAAAGSRDQLHVTVSIGAAQRGGALRTPTAVLERADQALYRAKRGGRNRVQLAPPQQG